MLRPSSGKRLFLIVPALLVLVACVKPAEPGVAVKTLQADIVFGVAPPGDATPPSVAPTIIEIEEGSLPEPTTPARRPVSPRPPALSCPDALETAFPEQVAGADVTVGPEVGRYRWKIGGATNIDGNRLPLGGFVTRRIRNVSSVTTSPNRLSDPPNESLTRTFTFELVDDAPNGGTAVSTYEVRSNPSQQTITSPAGTLQVGEPQRGVSLAKVTLYDAKGAATGAFTPTPAVTILPLQVAAGSPFTSVGVDTTTGSTLVHQATVGQRVPVDACGEMIDGWQVSAQQVFTNAAGQTAAVSYTYTIATQLGGMLIYEKTGPPANAPNAGAANVVELNIGQLHPTAETP